MRVLLASGAQASGPHMDWPAAIGLLILLALVVVGMAAARRGGGGR